MNELLQRAAERVQDSMDEILTNFKAGAKITVLVRTPDKPAADFCLTSDDLDEVIAMVQRRKGDTPSPQPNVRGRWRAFEDPAPGYWGIELEDAGNDDDAVLYPQKIHRNTVARIVAAHNATLDTTAVEADPGEHQEVLDAIAAHNSGEEE